MAVAIPRRAVVRALFILTVLLQITPGSCRAYTISQESVYKGMRGCAMSCLSFSLGIKFGCGFPLENECVCRTDLIEAATKHFSSCASKDCTVGPPEGDISTIISVHRSYCQSNGFTFTGLAAQPTTGGKQLSRGCILRT
jgi:hypothetical protein